MGTIFDYQIDINFFKIDETLKEKTGSFWAVVERFLFPESFVSDKGAFMFKIEEDEENSIDTWLLVISADIKTLINFLKGNITYGEFLSAERNKFYILRWDLKEFAVYAEQELSFSEVKKKVGYILNQKILPESKENIEKIIEFLFNADNLLNLDISDIKLYFDIKLYSDIKVYSDITYVINKEIVSTGDSLGSLEGFALAA